MKSFAQADPRWRADTVGDTKQTLGRVGCLVTAIADLSTFFGSNYTPAEINRVCKFTPDARLIWDSAYFVDFHFARRDYYYSLHEVADAVRDPHRGVVLSVQGGSHWVAPIRWSLIENCWIICDPARGDVCSIRRYKNEISGAAYFVRN